MQCDRFQRPCHLSFLGSSVKIQFLSVVSDREVTDNKFRANISSLTAPTCGDGIVSGDEICDGGTSSSPGCIDCAAQFGWSCDGITCTSKSHMFNTPLKCFCFRFVVW